jgi:hypothetical protein
VPTARFTREDKETENNNAPEDTDEGLGGQVSTTEETSDLSSPEPAQVPTSSDARPPGLIQSAREAREMFSKVDRRFLQMLDERQDYLISLINQQKVAYTAFDLFGFYDYYGMKETEDEVILARIASDFGIRIDALVTCARVYIREKYDDYLMYRGKEHQLQAVSEFMVNVFINKLCQERRDNQD